MNHLNAVFVVGWPAARGADPGHLVPAPPRGPVQTPGLRLWWAHTLCRPRGTSRSGTGDCLPELCLSQHLFGTADCLLESYLLRHFFGMGHCFFLVWGIVNLNYAHYSILVWGTWIMSVTASLCILWLLDFICFVIIYCRWRTSMSRFGWNVVSVMCVSENINLPYNHGLKVVLVCIYRYKCGEYVKFALICFSEKQQTSLNKVTPVLLYVSGKYCGVLYWQNQEYGEYGQG